MSKQILGAIYSAALIQGITLVAFPAASAIFTSPDAFQFTSTEYGTLFIPQAILSILSSALSPLFCKRCGAKEVFFAGLTANFLSMLLLAFSSFVMHDFSLAFALLMAATSCLGIGFGLTVPTLNMMAALLKPDKVNSTILSLNALLGAGTALAPVFIAFFTAAGFWWGLPSLLVLCIAVLSFASCRLAFPGGRIETVAHGGGQGTALPPCRFWLFAAVALVYGVIETLNGNWAVLYMRNDQMAAPGLQSLALTVFWGMVTCGRVLFAWIGRWLGEKNVFQVLPFIAAVAFLLIASLPVHREDASIFAFAIAGFGCSALLPLMISFGSIQLKTMTGSVAGGVIAFYLLGYGIAAFGVGPMEDLTGLKLGDIFGLGSIAAVLLGLLVYAVNRGFNKCVKEGV